MESQGTVLIANNVFMILTGVFGFLLIVALGIMFFISRKSQRVMQSLLDIMLRPESARVGDAVRVLNTIMATEMAKIEASFKTVCDTLNAHIDRANELKNQLGDQNEKLVSIADDATRKLAQMSDRLDNTLGGLNAIVDSKSWGDVTSASDRFSANINELLSKIDTTTANTTADIAQIQGQIESWVTTSDELSERIKSEFESNATQMADITEKSATMQQQLSELAQTTTDGFNNVKNASEEYGDVMAKNNEMLDNHLNKLDAFAKQSKKNLASQTNTITNTANVVAGQVRLTVTPYAIDRKSVG